MNLQSVEYLARQLMSEHGLINNGWKFKFDNAKLRFGRTAYFKKIISVSKHLALINNRNIVKDVILHEIAHALTEFTSTGHDEVFYQMCKKIGADPRRTYDLNKINSVRGNYIYICEICGYEYHRYRMNRIPKYSCPICHPGAYDRKYKLKLILK